MANTQLFKTGRAKNLPVTDTKNLAGGIAYSLSDEAALAQMAVTGCFGNTFYATADAQLAKVQELIPKVSSDFLARCAVYARATGFMKDMPALMLATLAARMKQEGTAGAEARDLFDAAFPLVVDNPKMLRNFVQIVRSGVTGRKSFGTHVRDAIRQWFASRSADAIFRGSVGGNPTIADIIRMVHPKAENAAKSGTYRYLIGKNDGLENVTPLIEEFEVFKASLTDAEKSAEPKATPKVPWEMLTALPLTPWHWKQIAKNASWTQARMNINTFKRHGALDDETVVNALAEKIGNPEAVKDAKAFPYQLLMAYSMTEDAPMPIRLALQDAMETATENIPEFEGQVFVCVDSSGSMSCPVTGARGTATSKVSCNDVASLFAASVLRKNPKTKIIRFDTSAEEIRLNPRDSVMTMAKQINRRGGGTDCASALRYINAHYGKGDLIVFVSDNESWIEPKRPSYYGNSSTATLNEFNRFRERNRHAKMACIDLTPNTTTQAPDTDGTILNVGGFNDRVFDVIAAFAKRDGTKESFVDVIKRTSLGGTVARNEERV